VSFFSSSSNQLKHHLLAIDEDSTCCSQNQISANSEMHNYKLEAYILVEINTSYGSLYGNGPP